MTSKLPEYPPELRTKEQRHAFHALVERTPVLQRARDNASRIADKRGLRHLEASVFVLTHVLKASKYRARQR